MPVDTRGGPIFAIGDVHGCADELDELLGILPLKSNCTVVFLGDYVDRGPKSRQVVDRVLELRRKHRVVTLRGNHESMLLEFLDGTNESKVARFVLNGGGATLANYANPDGWYEIPGDHIDFFQNLDLSYETPEHFFVHAGVPDMRLSDIDPEVWAEEMLWTRKSFLRSTFRWEKLIVHGHSPVMAVEVAPNRINLDTGCVFDRRLSAMEFPSHRIYSVERRRDPSRTLLRDGSRRATVRFRGAIPVELEVAGMSLAFETVDYSEIGLGVRAARPPGPSLSLGTPVSGSIGAEGLFKFRFEGHVARVSNDGEHEILGITIEVLESGTAG